MTEINKKYKILFLVRDIIYSMDDIRPLLLIENNRQRKLEQESNAVLCQIKSGKCWGFLVNADSTPDLSNFIVNPSNKLADELHIAYAIDYSTTREYCSVQLQPGILRYMRNIAGLNIG